MNRKRPQTSILTGSSEFGDLLLLEWPRKPSARITGENLKTVTRGFKRSINCLRQSACNRCVHADLDPLPHGVSNFNTKTLSHKREQRNLPEYFSVECFIVWKPNVCAGHDVDSTHTAQLDKRCASTCMNLKLTTITIAFALSISIYGQTTPRLGPGRKYTSIERLKKERLEAVHNDRARLARERKAVSLATGYNDYRAVLHAHAEDATHTGGSRPELLDGAKRAGVQIVMLSDHVRPERDFINDSWRGLREGVLFIPGAEDRGFLSFPMNSIKALAPSSREEYIGVVRRDGGNIFLCHVEERTDWPTNQLDGLEIYNHHSDVKNEAAFQLWLQGSLTDPVRLPVLVAALAEYPEEVIGAQQDYLSDIIAKWDLDAQHHRLTGVAANDCHHNQVFTVTAIDENTVEVGYITSKPTTTRITADKVPGVAALVRGKKPGELIARLDFDPYERSLRYVSTHILAHELTEASIRDALRNGHAYVAHDWLCDSTGFAFVALAGGKVKAIMGDEIKVGGALKLSAATPVKCTLKLIRNGEELQTLAAKRLDFEVKTPGVYRIEAWLELDGEKRPWIYSNPIYVR